MNKYQLDGAPNFRDIGGIKTRLNQPIHRGRIFRSDHLSDLTDHDLETLRRLGIQLIVDLRSHVEQRKHPSRLPHPATPRVLSLPITQDTHASPELMMLETLRDNPTPEGAAELMHVIYRNHPRNFIGRLNLFFDCIIDGEVPLVVHCQAGKDRTGFVCAMLLYALGASMDDIVADYTATDMTKDLIRTMASVQHYLNQALGFMPEPETLRPIFEARASYLAASFDAIPEEFGSIDAYLEHTAGLTPQRRQELHRRLLY